MGYPTRIYYSESERQKIFDRWLAGESQNAIARSVVVILRFKAFWHARAASVRASVDDPVMHCRWQSEKKYLGG